MRLIEPMVQQSSMKNLIKKKFHIGNLFLSIYLKKYQLNLSVGDIFIREAFIWHRGTKNNSKDPRILVNFIISENKNKDLNYDTNHEISFFDNMFSSNFRGKVKEFMNVRLRPFYFFYKFLRSLF